MGDKEEEDWSEKRGLVQIYNADLRFLDFSMSRCDLTCHSDNEHAEHECNEKFLFVQNDPGFTSMSRMSNVFGTCVSRIKL